MRGRRRGCGTRSSGCDGGEGVECVGFRHAAAAQLSVAGVCGAGDARRDAWAETFTGTSNTALAYKHDLEAIGTNAHELPMAMAAMARGQR